MINGKITEFSVLLNCWATVVNLDGLYTSLKLYSSFGGIMEKFVLDQTIDFTIPFVSFIEHRTFVTNFNKVLILNYQFPKSILMTTSKNWVNKIVQKSESTHSRGKIE